VVRACIGRFSFKGVNGRIGVGSLGRKGRRGGGGWGCERVVKGGARVWKKEDQAVARILILKAFVS
jgi:hypothetical protein